MDNRTMLLLASVFLGCLQLTHAADWPQFRGPSHDGISGETDWSDDWGAGGPGRLWKQEVGIGFATVSVADGRVVTMGYDADRDSVFCFAEDTGEPRWTHSYPSELGDKFYEGGPGSTPTISGGRVYAVSKWGHFMCLDLESGETVWKRQLVSEEGLEVPDWGFNGSVLAKGDVLFLNVGGAGMAFNASDGSTRWKSGTEAAGYSTPYPVGDDVIVSSGDGYVAVEANSGSKIWEIDWPTRYGVNAADPIVRDGRVLVASGYGRGAGMFDLSGDEPERIWRSRKLRAQQNAPVLIGEHLFGFDGDAGSRANLRCIGWKTGEEVWATEDLGYGSLTAAGDRLIALGAKGELAIVPASSEGYHPTARAKVMDGKCWTVPVLANGRLYCRTAEGTLACFDLRTK